MRDVIDDFSFLKREERLVIAARGMMGWASGEGG
jgi:hypothetical protein